MDLAEDIQGHGHVISMDYFFTSVDLLDEFVEKKIYATCIVRTNRIGLPHAFKNVVAFRNVLQGTLKWRMHQSCRMAAVVWKDKKPVLFFSTHAIPIGYPCMPVPIVPRWNGAKHEDIMTSPMHLEYTTNMHGVDVADQLHASYNTQNRTHKWWHRVFFFFLI